MVAWLFALPFVLVFGVFMLMPLVSSFAMSFTDFTEQRRAGSVRGDFVGIDQYVDLFGNPQFVKSMVNTAYVVVFGIPLTMAVGLALARGSQQRHHALPRRRSASGSTRRW